MDINDIISTIKENQPAANVGLVQNSFDFLQKALENFSFLDRRRIANESIERAELAADENAKVEFIAGCLLSDICRRQKGLLADIKKEIGEETGLIVESYVFTQQQLEAKDQPLYEHSFRTAMKLAAIKIDSVAICAALLHEIPSHTKITAKEMEKTFGKAICELIAQFQKIRAIKVLNNSQFIANLREMVVAMAADLRVIIIKMCSNIDRMQFWQTLSHERLHNIALESREILAPLADVLGIWHLRWQMEDNAFKILEPAEYEKIAQHFNVDERKNREKYIQKTKNILVDAAAKSGIECRVDGRFKHYYGIYNKMKAKSRRFDEIGDVLAFRVIARNIDECYRLLGIIHGLWRPKERRVKDYIAAPKNNKYRSLHTTVFGLNNRLSEFQIRTEEMDEEANLGITAHWYYKNSTKKAPAWIQELLVKQQQYKNDLEFLNKFNSEFIDKRIYIYTPKGDVIALPAGATPVDVAYQIHSEIGHHCQAAIINDFPAPLNHILSTNDVVNIIIDRDQPGPKREWLKFVKTNAAQKHIEIFFNKHPIF